MATNRTQVNKELLDAKDDLLNLLEEDAETSLPDDVEVGDRLHIAFVKLIGLLPRSNMRRDIRAAWRALRHARSPKEHGDANDALIDVLEKSFPDDDSLEETPPTLSEADLAILEVWKVGEVREAKELAIDRAPSGKSTSGYKLTTVQERLRPGSPLRSSGHIKRTDAPSGYKRLK